MSFHPDSFAPSAEPCKPPFRIPTRDPDKWIDVYTLQIRLPSGMVVTQKVVSLEGLPEAFRTAFLQVKGSPDE